MGKIPILFRRHAFFVLLFFIALIPRIYQLDRTTIYPDEVSWMVRSKEALYALKKENLGFFKEGVWWNSKSESESIGIPLSIVSGLSLILLNKDSGSVSSNLFPDYVAARIPGAFFAAVLISLFFIVSRRLFSTKQALLAALLLSLDPVHIGLSRWVINDPFLSFATFFAISLFILGVKKRNQKFIMLSGVSLGLGFLTKPLGLLPVASWVVYCLLVKVSSGQKTKALILSSLSALVTILLLWPSSWFNPIISIFEYVIRQFQLDKIGIAYYFFGQVSINPPWFVYFFGILTRLPLLISLGLVFSLTFAITKIGRKLSWQKLAVPFSIFTFCALLLFFVSVSNLNQGVRYVLPLWPWIYLLVAWGYLQALERIKSLAIRRLTLFLLLGGNLISILSYHPEQMFFYNSLLGGAGNAQRYDLVGRCYGIKEAIEFINRCYPGTPSLAILGCSNVTAPYYYHGRITTDWQREKLVVVENSFKQLLPNEDFIKYFDSIQPVYIATQKGAVVSRVYQIDGNLRSRCLTE